MQLGHVSARRRPPSREMRNALSLRGAAASHDGPSIEDPIALRNVVTIIVVRAVVQNGAINLDAFAEFEASIAILPLQQTVLSALRAHVNPGFSLDSVRRAHAGLVAVIDGGLAGMPLAVDGGENGKSKGEIRKSMLIGLASDGGVSRVHKHVGTDFEFGETKLVVDVVRTGGAAGENIDR